MGCGDYCENVSARYESRWVRLLAHTESKKKKITAKTENNMLAETRGASASSPHYYFISVAREPESNVQLAGLPPFDRLDFIHKIDVIRCQKVIPVHLHSVILIGNTTN